jgi:hypothetical protein
MEEGCRPVPRAGKVAAAHSWFPFFECFLFQRDSLHEMIGLVSCAEGRVAHLRDRLTLRFLGNYTAVLPIT